MRGPSTALPRPLASYLDLSQISYDPRGSSSGVPVVAVPCAHVHEVGSAIRLQAGWMFCYSYLPAGCRGNVLRSSPIAYSQAEDLRCGPRPGAVSRVLRKRAG